MYMLWVENHFLQLPYSGGRLKSFLLNLHKRSLKEEERSAYEAGIPLAGGHSIDSPEPIFGLAVTGIVNKENLKKNNTAEEGDLIFLTKPLGVGILSTAQKRGLLKEEYLQIMVKQMTTLIRSAKSWEK